MKKFCLILIVILFTVSNLNAQLKFKAGLVNGPFPNTVDIMIQPTVNFTGYLTNVVFVFQIPAGVTQPTITKTTLTPYFVFTAANDLPTLANEAGYATYGLASVNSSNTTPVTINAGTTYPVLRLTFNGGLNTPTDVRLAHLAGGGPNTLYQNYIEANAGGPGTNDYTNYVQMFFGALVQPAAPYADEATGYANYQYSQRAQVLPLKWLSFNAIKKDNDGLLNWAVSNDEENHHFEVLRSNDGQNFTTIAQVNKSGNGNYNYTDAGIVNLSVPVLYYRIKQVDINGKFSYSDIKMLRPDTKTNQISIYPNPIKEGFYISIPFANPGNRIVKLNLIGANGQVVLSKEITTLQAVNYYFKIADKALAAGQYNLQIIFEDRVMETKKLYINP